MYENTQIGVVVPAYNESNLVGETIQSVPAYVDCIYAIDDGSTDDTWQVIQETAERMNERSKTGAVADGGHSDSPTVVPIQHRQNKGAGAAVKNGYRAALDDDMDVVVVMNGDGQMDPTVLPRLLDPVTEGRADFAQGDRLSRSENIGDMSRWRLFGNYLLTLLTRFSSGYWRLLDPQNGYTVIDSDTLSELPLEDLYDDYGFLNDLLTALNLQDARIIKVPHRSVYGEEESTISYSRFVPGLSGLLLRNFLYRLSRRAPEPRYLPVVGCYALGALSILLGALGFGRAAMTAEEREGDSRTESGRGMMIGTLVFLAGIALDARASASLEVSYDADDD